jgi:SAM-dependent methyltransferase
MSVKSLIKSRLPKSLKNWIRARRFSTCHPPVGSIRWGSLRRLDPVSRSWGIDRGGFSMYRGYIHEFLTRNAADIRGRVLEFGEDRYTPQFGDGRVTQSDVLSPVPGNPRATMVADLTRADPVPSEAFDCILCTEVLTYIYDVRSACAHLHRVLKPGGVLLATFPGITKINPVDRALWGEYWHYTSESVKKLLSEYFPSPNVAVESFGNVLVAIAALHGLSWQELREEERNHHDPEFEVLITVRAVKPQG